MSIAGSASTTISHLPAGGRLHVNRWLMPAALALFLICSPTAQAQKPGDQSESEPASTIEQWIEELGHESYALRKEATRRLCEVGLAAQELLQQAAASADAEVALRARQVLDTLAARFFSGLEAQLTISESPVVWNKSFNVSITFRNTSMFRSRVPIEIDPAMRAKLSTDARQVGDMLDVADWLLVRNEDGKPVELRIDDILADTKIAHAVDRRVKGEPISYLAAGASYTLHLTGFNRGWARYPFLEAGRYTVQFDYAPAWEDEWLRTRKVGRVTSNLAGFVVTESAPPTVDRGRIEAELTLAIDGQNFVAMLTNRTDRIAVINRNLGAIDPFAKVQWIHACGQQQHVLRADAKANKTWKDFRGENLVSVEPGDAIPVASINIEALKTALEAMGANLACPGAQWHATYESLGNRQWQARQGKTLLGNSDAPEALRVPLPRRLLTVRLASPAIKTTPGE